MSKLSAALRRRFKDPQEAMAALGLDSALLEDKETTIMLSPKALVAKGAILGYLRPRLAVDQKIDIAPILDGITAKNFTARRPVIEAAVKIAMKNKLAKDADLEDLGPMLEAVGETIEEAITGEGGGGGEPNEEGSEEEGKDLEANSGEPPAVEPSKKKEEDIIDFLKDKLQPEDLSHIAELLRAEEGGEEEAKVDPDPDKGEDDNVWHTRATDARKRLGRDESAEERDEREKKESAKDARDRLGRDETEEERTGRETEDKRRADDRRAKDTRSARDRRGARDDPPPFKGKPETGGTMVGGVTKEAMDAAIARAENRHEATIALKLAERDQQHRDARAAEKFVRPLVGELAIAYDSAEAVYKAALQMKNVKVDGVHPSAFRTILENLPRQNANPQPARISMDAAASKSFAERFPDAARVEIV